MQNYLKEDKDSEKMLNRKYLNQKLLKNLKEEIEANDENIIEI